MTKTTTPPELHSLDDVRAWNERAGFHFFEPATLRFFRSRIGEELYGSRYFVTSEQGPEMPRLYTVRAVDVDGSIEAVGGFQQFTTGAQARRAARACAAADSRISVTRDPYPDVNVPEGPPDPERYEWRPYIFARGGTYAVGLRTTHAAAAALRAWLLAPRSG